MFGLLLGAIAISTAPILVKLSQLEPGSLAFFRCFFAFLILFPFCLRKSDTQSNFWKSKNALWILLGSICFAADLFVWHRSIYYIGAGMATILGNTQAIYLPIFGAIFLKEKLNFKFYLAISFAFIGIFLLVDPKTELAGVDLLSSNYFWGVVFGLLTGIFYSGYIFFLRLGQSSVEKMPSSKKLAYVAGLTSLTLLPFLVAQGSFEFPSAENWYWVLLVALIPQVLGWLVITHSLPKIPIGRAGLILLLQPVLATIWSFLIFHERLHSIQLAGGALTLFGVYLGNTSRVPNSKKTITSEN